MVTTCIMCGGNAKGYGTSAKIAGILLKPLCSDCKKKCSTDPDRAIAYYPHLFDRNQPVSTNRLVKEPSIPNPTAHPTSGQQAQTIPEGSSTLSNTVSSLMNNPKSIVMIVLIIGVALIIISPNLLFREIVPGGYLGLGIPRTTDLRNVTLFFGVALLIVGGIISARGFSQFTSTQTTTPSAPTTQPVVPQSVSPKSIALGNTPHEVQSVMGQPNKIINLGARVIHIYKDMKIIYVDGKVSDVQLS